MQLNPSRSQGASHPPQSSGRLFPSRNSKAILQAIQQGSPARAGCRSCHLYLNPVLHAAVSGCPGSSLPLETTVFLTLSFIQFTSVSLNLICDCTIPGKHCVAIQACSESQESMAEVLYSVIMVSQCFLSFKLLSSPPCLFSHSDIALDDVPRVGHGRKSSQFKLICFCYLLYARRADILSGSEVYINLTFLFFWTIQEIKL